MRTHGLQPLCLSKAKYFLTDTLNQQQALINRLQADMDKASKDHNEKVEQVRDQGIEHFILLNEKLDTVGGVLIRKTDEATEHREEQFKDNRPTEEGREKS